MKTDFDGVPATGVRGAGRRSMGIERPGADPVSPQPVLCGRTIALRRDAALYREGEPAREVWLVKTGILRLQRIGADGRRQILNLLLPGDLIGDELQGRPGLNIEACTDATLSQMRLSDFQDMMQRRSDLRRAVLVARMVHLERMRWLTWMLGALRPEERLCAFLAIGERILAREPQPDGSEIVSVPLSRQDLSDLLGITAESICRILHRLQDSGVLEIVDPARFRIVNPRQLQEKGCIDALSSALALVSPDISRLMAEGQTDPARSGDTPVAEDTTSRRTPGRTGGHDGLPGARPIRTPAGAPTPMASPAGTSGGQGDLSRGA